MPNPMFDGPAAPAPLLSADFAGGEQFWKFWTTGKVQTDEEVLRFKIFSKRVPSGRFEFICATDLEDGRKVVWGEGAFESDAALVAFAGGARAALVHLIGHEIHFDLVDFSSCRTFEQWNYKMRESTTIRIWNSDDGAKVKGEA